MPRNWFSLFSNSPCRQTPYTKHPFCCLRFASSDTYKSFPGQNPPCQCEISGVNTTHKDVYIRNNKAISLSTKPHPSFPSRLKYLSAGWKCNTCQKVLSSCQQQTSFSSSPLHLWRCRHKSKDFSHRQDNENPISIRCFIATVLINLFVGRKYAETDCAL